MTKLAGKTKVHLATDIKEPINLHWALSVNKAGEWLVNFLNLLTEKASRNAKYLINYYCFLLYLSWILLFPCIA